MGTELGEGLDAGPHETELVTRGTLFMWRCACGQTSGGRWYTAAEEAEKAGRRHRERAQG